MVTNQILKNRWNLSLIVHNLAKITTQAIEENGRVPHKISSVEKFSRQPGAAPWVLTQTA